MTLIGFVTTGQGLASDMIDKLIKKGAYANFNPYNGTLNLSYKNLNPSFIKKMRNQIKSLPHFYDKEGNIYYTCIYKNIPLFLIDFKDKVEIMAEFKLRDILNLTDGEMVVLEVEEWNFQPIQN